MNYDYGNDFDNNEDIFDKNYIDNLNSNPNTYYNYSNDVPYYDEELDKKDGNKFCIISVVCYAMQYLITMPALVFEEVEILQIIFGLLSSAMSISAFVLMIYVRVRYPKNVFGKVLMWLYILMIVIPIVCGILFIATIYVMCSGLSG